MVAIPRLVLAAPASGSGKTTVACGLMAAFRARGLAVSGHKVGPDYIDPSYHALATGRPPRNLDPVLCGEELIAPLFLHGAAGAQVAVVEGVMGLFDGIYERTVVRRSCDDFGSTAHVARLLNAPVVLVIDSSKAGRSVAALVAGFAGFDPRTRVAGVILNRVGSDRHEQLLRDALSPSGIPVFGAIRRTGAIETPSRHLGLIPAAERHAQAIAAISHMSALIQDSCDLAALLSLARHSPPLPAPPWTPTLTPPHPSIPPTPTPSAPVPLPPAPPGPPPPAPASTAPGPPPPAPASVPDISPVGRDVGYFGRVSAVDSGFAVTFVHDSPPNQPQGPKSPRESRGLVAVAGGAAFTFGYTEQVELLEAAGLEVARFDPLRDEDLPEGTAGLIIGGGFPEVHAAELSANERLRSRVAALAASGVPVLAECAGLLYLARTLDGQPMCGVLDVDAAMSPKLTLGYRLARAMTDSPIAGKGDQIRGHEFHRTEVPSGLQPAWLLEPGGPEGHVKGSVVASYLHTHWAGHPTAAARFAAACAS